MGKQKGEKVSSKEKLDKLFGIEDGGSIDDFLDTFTVLDDENDCKKLEEAVSEIDNNVKENIDNIDKQIKEISKTKKDVTCDIQDINDSLKEVEEMIVISKKLFKHVYISLTSTDLIDSELLSSASKLLESIHVNIAEFISLYKERQGFVDRIKLMMFQQEQKKELMNLKHQQDMEKLEYKTKHSNMYIEVKPEETVEFSQEKIIKMLDDEMQTTPTDK